MRLHYKSTSGHYNWANPEEVSNSCHVAIFDEKGEKIKAINIKTDWEVEGSDVQEAIELIRDQLERVWSTAEDKWKEMIEYLENNKEEIEKGNKEYRVDQIKKEIAKLQDELKVLTN